MGIGGVETGIRDISKYLKKQDIKSYILCETNNNNFRDKNLNLIYLDGLKFKNLFHQNKIKIFIAKLIKKKEINLVHISSRAPAFFLLNFFKKKQIKVVTSVHNLYKPGFLFKNWYNSFLLKGDAVIFNSYFVKNSYKSIIQVKKKYYVVPRGIDTDYFNNSSNNTDISTKKIFLPSRISNWKGHEVLIKYFCELIKRYPNQFKLIFISNHQTSFEKKIDTLIYNLSINKYVIFKKPTLNIKRLYQECYLAINISKRAEGFGRTISESLSMSKPILAPNKGGTKEQLDKFDKKLLFDVDSFKSFHNSLRYLMNNYSAISKKGRKYVIKNYDSNLMCQKTLKIYFDIIG
tara:strand:+ start:410 stop:1453 length:1044 start_codon:yes stop_codon:yes gene_type:complete